jgi:uncharacterized membrane protein (UPF0127 family)
MLPARLERLPRIVLPGGAVIHEATSFSSRLLGLALLAELPPGHGLFIPRCRSVHTFGMRFPIDIAFIDSDALTIRIVQAVPPRRALAERDAAAIIECNAGEIGDFVGRALRSVG